MKNKEKYSFAVGRIRALEKKLIDNSRLERMIDAKEFSEAVRILLETEYAEHYSESEIVDSFEKVLSDELERVLDMVFSMVQDDEAISILLKKYEIHNIKVLLRYKVSSEEMRELPLINVAGIHVDAESSIIEEQRYSELGDIIGPAVKEAEEVLVKTKNVQLADMILDRALFEYMGQVSSKLDSNFFMMITELLADLTNIKTFIRIKRLKKDSEFLQKALVPYGSIDSQRFVSGIELSIKDFFESLKLYYIYKYIEPGLLRYIETSELDLFEKLSEDLVLKLYKEAKYVTYGPEPIAAYIAGKETEVKMIRLVLSGKKSDIPSETIRERMRTLYA